LYAYPLNPNIKTDPLGLTQINMGAGFNERASLGLSMAENGASPEELTKAMAPFHHQIQCQENVEPLLPQH